MLLQLFPWDLIIYLRNLDGQAADWLKNWHIVEIDVDTTCYSEIFLCIHASLPGIYATGNMHLVFSSRTFTGRFHVFWFIFLSMYEKYNISWHLLNNVYVTYCLIGVRFCIINMGLPLIRVSFPSRVTRLHCICYDTWSNKLSVFESIFNDSSG